MTKITAKSLTLRNIAYCFSKTLSNSDLILEKNSFFIALVHFYSFYFLRINFTSPLLFVYWGSLEASNINLFG